LLVNVLPILMNLKNITLFLITGVNLDKVLQNIIQIMQKISL